MLILMSETGGVAAKPVVKTTPVNTRNYAPGAGSSSGTTVTKPPVNPALVADHPSKSPSQVQYAPGAGFSSGMTVTKPTVNAALAAGHPSQSPSGTQTARERLPFWRNGNYSHTSGGTPKGRTGGRDTAQNGNCVTYCSCTADGTPICVTRCDPSSDDLPGFPPAPVPGWEGMTNDQLAEKCREGNNTFNEACAELLRRCNSGDIDACRKRNTCTPERLHDLNEKMHRICDQTDVPEDLRGTRCKWTDTCSELIRKILAKQQCIDARWEVVNSCYQMKMDASHQGQVAEVEKGIVNCLVILMQNGCDEPEEIKQIKDRLK
ncbi:MAG: hypothetical protein JNM70_22650 [Anaerolineae bacterium]|nr:hypothetical protein [Anaerolineae bacterium]